jgi:RecA/RadA recombinase
MEMIKPGKVKAETAEKTNMRVSTGLYMLDLAIAHEDEIGMPLRTGLELYGKPESGKSSLAYYLAGRVAPTGLITLIDLEVSGRGDYIESAVSQSGFTGTVKEVEWVDGKGKGRSHEQILKVGANTLLDDQGDANALILDSMAMVQPVVEREGDIEQAFMGKRAQVLAKFTRRWLSWIRLEQDKPKLVLLVNHMLADMGSQYSPTNIDWGFVTPGGFTPKFGCSARLRMTRKETFDDGSFEATIKIDKLRYGGRHKGRLGRAIIVPGVGVSPHLTAAFDCMELELARRKNSVQIKDGEEWKNVGRLSTLFDWARAGKYEKFKPFYNALSNVKEEA